MPRARKASQKTGGGKFGIRFQSFERLAEQYDKAGADIKVGVTQILEDTASLLTPEIKKEMNKYPKVRADEYGRHIEDYIINAKKVHWDGNIASINVGFLMQGQGRASIYLIYDRKVHGTPRTTPGYIEGDKALYNAVKGMGPWRKKVHDLQKQGFIEAMERQLNKK